MCESFTASSILNNTLKSQVFVQDYVHLQSFISSTVMKESHRSNRKLVETQACEQDFCRQTCGHMLHDHLVRDRQASCLDVLVLQFDLITIDILERPASQALCCASLQTRVIPGWHLQHVGAHCFLACFFAGISC